MNDASVYNFFKVITHLGDSAFLVPLSVALVAALLWQGRRSAAWRVAVTVGMSVGVTLAAKLWFYAEGGSDDLNILSPSGHASFSVALYGCLAMILAAQRRTATQVLIFAGVSLLVAAVIASRLILEVHTPEEVVFGTVVGIVCVLASALHGSDLLQFRFRPPVWLMAVLVLGSISVWTVGHHFRTERLIERWGEDFGATLGLS